MPRGIPNKKEEVEVKEPIEVIRKAVEEKPEVKPEPVKPKLEPLAVGQAYFESPDGVVIIGDATKDQVWYRAGNNGKGLMINKKR